MKTQSLISNTAPAVPAPRDLPATETDFRAWLQQLLPGVRAALARQGFERTRNLAAFQHFLRNQPDR